MSDEKMAERASAYIAQQRAQFTDGLLKIHTAHLRLQSALDTAITERDEARAEVERMRGDAQAIAAIAHTGGTVGLSEHEALIEIRRRTLRAWDGKTFCKALKGKP